MTGFTLGIEESNCSRSVRIVGGHRELLMDSLGMGPQVGGVIPWAVPGHFFSHLIHTIISLKLLTIAYN